MLLNKRSLIMDKYNSQPFSGTVDLNYDIASYNNITINNTVI